MALNSNQVKSLQAGVHADAGGLYLVVRGSGDRVWAFRFTDPEGKWAQIEFARAGAPMRSTTFVAARLDLGVIGLPTLRRAAR
ncbi:DUF4102 domain-containing protein [Bradyrhizobium sacchari]|uniref:DUF4102 domain-containing protein n=1 Tax=Bradyrhizobium sacchari TaxID=1399419 RepID=UPI00142F1364|nr:DUF4102 domain-containing protein [Bradyrhizobium sacchari]